MALAYPWVPGQEEADREVPGAKVVPISPHD